MRDDVSPTEILDPFFIQTVVQHAAYLLEADGSAFYFWDEIQNQATLMAKHNLASIPWNDAIPRRVVDSHSNLIETFPHRPALLAVPAVLHDHIRGVLVVADWNSRRLFGEKDVAMLQSLIDLAVLASRQTQRLARMTAQFRALHAIDIALTSSLDLDRLLNLILEKAIELVGADHGSLRQLKPETGELILRAHYGAGWTPGTLAYTPKVGEGIMQWVAEHRQPYLSADVRKDPHYVVLFENMRSSVAVPLLDARRDRTEIDDFLGVLLLESQRLAAFDRQDLELLDALAQEAVIAIQNATQHQRLQAMHRKLKDEQEKRLAAEKWTVMGQAATSLAHRINNLIGILPASADEVRHTLSAMSLADGDRRWIDNNLDRIEHNARFILSLSDNLFRPFKESGPPGRFDVNQLLNEALESADLPPTIEVFREYQPDLPKVESSTLLVDIFLELITNARKAMASRPWRRLTLRTRAELEDSREWVAVEIRDTGRGIDPDRMEHLWDMFQRSKTGLGFGLWWIRTFIVRQGGTVDCSSCPDEGACFTIRLPACADR
jgi:signal transduction histidine kinase